MAGFVEWADPCAEVFEVYRASVARGCDECDLIRGCVDFDLSPENAARVKV